MKNITNYYLPTRIVFGNNSIERIPELVTEFNPKNIALVTGKTAMRKFGVTDRVIKLLDRYNVVVFDKVEENPCCETVDLCVEFLKQNNCDIVIGLGGGSAMDVAKSAAVLVNNPGETLDYHMQNQMIKKTGLPFIAITTTSGTASEVTKFAVLTNASLKLKKALVHDFLYPEIALIDPLLTKTMNKDITYSTGLDALSHAVEAYWSKNTNPISQIHSLESIKLVFENLKGACETPDDLKYREGMAKASLFAGLSFSNAGTNVLHAISYPLTVHYNVLHGIACAAAMKEFFKVNKDAIDLQRIIKTTNSPDFDDFLNKLDELLNINEKLDLSKFGLKKEDMNDFVEKAYLPSKFKNNPVEISKEQLKKILSEIL
ncbi:iron-containing alcohol dehydrogenase [Candidatus Woesearchaeota archaeon]|nr:iron-containing alcohol dehydrogenase [Candidatus Woesearchaeota archaeon]